MVEVKGRILALSWTMPPLVFPRSLQISRSLRALGQRGWSVSVVTITPEAEPFATFDGRLAGFYDGTYKRVLVNPREDTKRSPYWLRAWRKFSPPSDLTADNWVRRANHTIRREIRAGRCDALITFAQPWIDHTVGLRIKKGFPSLPWIAHFSDPWVDSPYVHFENDAARKEAETRERAIIGGSDAVIFVNQYTADLVMAKYPDAWRSKVHVIPHGIEADFARMLPAKCEKDSFFRMVHTGNFYEHRQPDLIFQALKILADEDPEFRARARLELVGYINQDIKDRAAEVDLKEIVVFSGRRAYLDSLEIANRADLLLLIDAPADRNVFLPSKIVDYLMLQRPILGVTPAKGASAEVLQKLECPVVNPTDLKAITISLREAFRRWTATGSAGKVPDLGEAMQFSMHAITDRFEDVLARVLPSATGTDGSDKMPKPKKRSPTATALPLQLLSEKDIMELVDDKRGGHRTPTTIILWKPDFTLAEALLATEGVESIILPITQAPPAMTDSQRYGWWDLRSDQLHLPSRLGRQIFGFVPGGQWRFGLRAALRLMRHGVRRVRFRDIDFGTQSEFVFLLVLGLGTRTVFYRLGRGRARRVIERIDQIIGQRELAKLSRIQPPTAPFVPGRTILVAGSLGPGGSERQTVNTLVGLKASGVTDLTLLHERPLVPPDDFFDASLKEAGLTCLHLDREAMETPPASETADFQHRILATVNRMGMRGDIVLNYYRIIRNRRPEIVHTWLDAINVSAGLAALLAGVPRVIIGCRSLAPYNFPFHQPYMRPVYRLLSQHSSVTLLNNSESGAADYASWIGTDVSIRVINNGFVFAQVAGEREVHDLRRQLGIPHAAPVVGTIMRLSQEKRPLLWLDVAERISDQHPDAHFVVIGDGPMMPEVQQKVAASPISKRILLLGQRKDATELLAMFDAFMLTSAIEGLPNVVIEAQAAGVPVVATDVGGVREVLAEGHTGLVVAVPTVDALAAGVNRILTDSELQTRAKDQAPGAMRDAYSMERMVRETLEVYGKS